MPGKILCKNAGEDPVAKKFFQRWNDFPSFPTAKNINAGKVLGAHI